MRVMHAIMNSMDEVMIMLMLLDELLVMLI